MSRRHRSLRPEEEALWKLITDRTKPMHPDRKPPEVKSPIRAKTEAPDGTPRSSAAPPRPIEPFQLGSDARHRPETRMAMPDIAEQLARTPVQMDAGRFRKMRSGKLEVEGRIDLHGLTLSEAHPRLMSFLFSSHAAGKRLVLVITGKGKDRDDGTAIPAHRGLLRHQVPHWITTGPAKSIVLQVTPAHRRHGGSGALYIYLRRR
ncbi:DNA mismatch repair protein MutS [Palleronia caenipelagi]|uniref:DNA mismatch repair protein MutS n=2 Tax=Palleronia caenipelagi TaxID=2489174 RepID=A0A547Q8W2_9RHOB|nr:DNA mismatch repair protein MutS [Palleronia caenipelagi]